MKSSLTRIAALLSLCMPLLAVNYGFSQCTADDPAGRFEGSATSGQAGKLDIRLNLICSEGHYAGMLDTPLGNYTLTTGSFSNGQLRLQFTRPGVTAVDFDLTAAGSQWQGTFHSGDDHGPVVIVRTGDPLPLSAGPGMSAVTSRQWAEDLAVLTDKLPKLHPNPFAFTPKDKFEAAAAELKIKLTELNPDQIYIGLDHLANLIGDAHTFVEFPSDLANLPLDIHAFEGVTRVDAVAPGYDQALGARVVAIGDTPIKEARRLAAAITPVGETRWLRDSRVDGFLTTGMVLHGFGITADRNSATYTLANDKGRQFTVNFKALEPGDEPKWVHPYAATPLASQPVPGGAACTYLSAARSVYCNVSQIRNLAGPARQMFEMIRQNHPTKLVIDLRNNVGGDYNEGLENLIKPLQGLKAINRKGHLFVLIGPNTFSAAMSNAAQFRSMTNAILVGQPIGERPNSYQEPRQFTLPNSHLVVRYSTRYYKFSDGPQNVIAPDHEITPTWQDYKNGRDGALEWALEYRD